LYKSHPVEAPSPPLHWDRFVRITKLLSTGSTGGVYHSFMEEMTLVVKIVEILHSDNELKRQRLWTELGIYSHLEHLLGSSKLLQHITPQFYGSFQSKQLEALIMELHSSSLSHWDELGSLEK
jgi:hypothetical protein